MQVTVPCPLNHKDFDRLASGSNLIIMKIKIKMIVTTMQQERYQNENKDVIWIGLQTSKIK